MLPYTGRLRLRVRLSLLAPSTATCWDSDCRIWRRLCSQVWILLLVRLPSSCMEASVLLRRVWRWR
ncbi:hypothetical protein D3C72_2210060 [compost metagenome]